MDDKGDLPDSVDELKKMVRQERLLREIQTARADYFWQIIQTLKTRPNG